MIHITVAGGTNAGTKRPLKDVPYSWLCKCPNPTGRRSRTKLNPGYLVNCLDCGERRPS